MNVKADIRVANAIDEVIDGRNVKRFVHELELDGEDYTPLFRERLLEAGFKETVVGNVDIGFDERVAAFALRGSKAYFGWIFIERFTEKKSRKLFGSVVRNKKGDWAIQIPSNSKEKVFVNYAQKLDMEPESNFVLE